MPGKWLTNQQVELYMKTRQSGKTQVTSAAIASVSERTGRNIEQGKRTCSHKKKRHKNTRKDPLIAVWESELVPMLEALPQLQPITLLEYLQEKHCTPDGNPIYQDNILRTLQRRVKRWKATQGPKREVMFRQEHIPGRLGLSDFTNPKDFVIIIKGEEFKHILYHFRLAYSHWSYMKVIEGGESFSALSDGLQEALWCLGAAPLEHRTDSLSAAFKNLTDKESKDCCESYHLLCEHYGIKPTRNNLGVSHENGSIESPHGHLKRRIKQALMIRGSHDFNSVQEYQDWLNSVVRQHNRRNAKALSIEHPALQMLPTARTIDYTELFVKVSSSSTIDVRRVTYTVPSQLQGETLRVHLHHDHLMCYLGTHLVHNTSRVYPCSKTMRARQINYCHVIHSLVKKPQAFRYSALRNDLLPTATYKNIWEYVDATMAAREACRFIVGLLYLASKCDCEKPLGDKVISDIANKKFLKLSDYKMQFDTSTSTTPELIVNQHHLNSYDALARMGE